MFPAYQPLSRQPLSCITDVITRAEHEPLHAANPSSRKGSIRHICRGQVGPPAEKLREMATSFPPSKRAAIRPAPRADSFDPAVAKACGTVLRAWRLERELAQDSFALLAGIDRSYYGKLERGERQPSLSVLLKCAAAFAKPGAALVEAIECAMLNPPRNARAR
ncbi:MAG: XRE family transcriptional regulator [Rubrivivax sp.]|nr:MAG: XRE family transcriptional regulator [Rubrivivax sp.]